MSDALQIVTRPESSRRTSGRMHFSFSGRGAEYFRIWIVNLLLTIMTVGIYSAWAKVRRNRYIYGSTRLQEGRFDYHARPIAILRGRLLAVGALLLYLVGQSFVPLLALILPLLLALSIPWLIVRARMFNMRYTSYRNIRFGFEPAYGRSYFVILAYGLLTLLTAGLAAPYAHYQRNRFIVDNTRYGNLSFSMQEGSASFFIAYFLTFLAGAVVVFPLTGFVFALLAGISSTVGGGDGVATGIDTTAAQQLAVLATALGGMMAYYVLQRFLSAAVLRATVRATLLGNGIGNDNANEQAAHRLGCDWSLNRLLFIFLTNFIFVVCSLGLLIPWARMRETRYLVDGLWIEVTGDLDHVVAGQADEVSSLGEEIGDVFDLDIGF